MPEISKTDWREIELELLNLALSVAGTFNFPVALPHLPLRRRNGREITVLLSHLAASVTTEAAKPGKIVIPPLRSAPTLEEVRQAMESFRRSVTDFLSV